MKFVDRLLPFFPSAETPDLSWKLYEDNNFRLDTMKNVDGLRGYQKFIQLFMSPYTPYRTLLMKHSMGSGKTRTALAVILIHFYYSPATKCLIVSPNRNHIANISDLIIETAKQLYATDPKLPSILSYLKSESNITFLTFNGVKENHFARANLIIIDEVHEIDLRKDGGGQQPAALKKVDLYEKFSRMIERHVLPDKRKRLLMLTGTPITDHYTKLFEIVDLMLERKDKFLASPKGFFDRRGVLKPDAVNLIKDRFRGKVSTFQMISPEVPERVMGGYYDYKRNRTTKKYREGATSRTMVYLDLMPEGSDQAEYAGAASAEGRNAEEDFLFVFPGGQAFGDVLVEEDHPKDGIHKLQFRNNAIRQSYEGLFSDREFLRTHGILYHNVLELMGVWDPPEDNSRRREAVFFFNSTVKTTGNKLFSFILPYFRFIRLEGSKMLDRVMREVTQDKLDDERSAYRRFVITSSKFGVTTDFNRVVKIFQHKNNREGKYLRLIVGSEVASQGYNLINGRQVHTVVQWSDVATRQATARVLRGQSNFDTPEEATVKIFNHYIGIQNNASEQFPYFNRLRAMETKQSQNAQVLHVFDIMAVDCVANQKFHSQPKYDFRVECNYKRCSENYACEKKTKDDDGGGGSFFVFESDSARDRFRNMLEDILLKRSNISIAELIKDHAKAWSLTPGEVYRYTLNIMLSRERFFNNRGFYGPIATVYDVLYVDYANAQDDSQAIASILQPVRLVKSPHMIDGDAAYGLTIDKDILDKVMSSRDPEEYKKLCIFSKVWLFEKSHSDGDAKMIKFTEEMERGKFFLTDDGATMNHVILPTHQVKTHTLQHVQLTEGVRRLSSASGNWEFVQLQPDAAPAAAVPLSTTEKKRKKRGMATSKDQVLMKKSEGDKTVYKIANIDILGKGNAKPNRKDILELIERVHHLAKERGVKSRDVNSILTARKFKDVSEFIRHMELRTTRYLEYLDVVYKLQTLAYNHSF